MTEFSNTSGNPDKSIDVERVSFHRTADGSLPDTESVERVKKWLMYSARGQQVYKHMDGEGPGPDPLFTAVEYENGDQRLLLEDGSVDVTDADYDSRMLLDGLFDRPKPSDL